jgi:RimJ/RimL family protein N-acetyltransferase
MFTFSDFKKCHLPILRSWLHQPHVKKYWQESDDDTELEVKFLQKHPARGVQAFIVGHDDKEIGYIQYYDAKKLGGGWWELEPPGTFGIDLMIGSTHAVGKGLGPLIIKEFVNFLCSREVGVRSIVIDPDPQNRYAILAFEKAGFSREKEIITPGGAALLMRMKVDELKKR